MKIFLDTANVRQIREAFSWGILDGVTTNPTLVSKENAKFKDLIKEICDIVLGPVSVESVSTKAEDIIEESRTLAKIADNVVVKIPICVEGLKAIKVLSQEGIHINTTLIFSPLQALLAAKAGAMYVSPFVGRLDDIAHEGINLVEEIVTIFDNYGIDTEIIVGSVRHPLHVVEAALIGADIATIPFGVLEKMVRHPLTDIGMEKFLDDWKKVKKN
ncbi:MAG: fructose-6-phosphate aldolase [Candidatus Aminicenantes bacterium]|jgi:transaldolase|nr:fructose-6-phosphate aldolase [Candidatus Aminicenantes bacterium]MDH5383163.1 fructose-6-phosphate aldolase [Candidatus Aminicenantes bacterium]MDH5744314.1 fructose-6-phosphate aldolase [Candidatus Aminicenantes bacterium]